MLDADTLNVGDGCRVKWNGSELLAASVVDNGDKAAMDKAEKEHLKAMYEKEETTTELPPPKKKTKCIEKENKTRTPYRKSTTTRRPLAHIQNVRLKTGFVYNWYVHMYNVQVQCHSLFT